MESMKKKTKIVCTLGPSTASEEVLRKLIENGMDVARMNFSHGDHESHGEEIRKIKKLRQEMNVPVAILLDTKGPEIRTGVAKDEKSYTLVKGNQVTITTRDVVCDSKTISVTYEDLPKDVSVGGTILISDGLIELKILSIEGTEILCEVLNGGELSSRKGVNVPNVKLNLPAITNQDREDIIFGINEGVDFIAASFIRNAEAIREIRKILKESNSDIAIIAKIENMEGVENLDEIIAESDGIMVARGDLGVEVETQRLPFLQKTMIEKCNAAFKLVITATQMLDSMIRNPRPTRAEVSDVANAIYDGTDAIMLSGETAAGKYPIEAVKMMAEIAIETEQHLEYTSLSKARMISTIKQKEAVSSAISYSAVATAQRLGAKLIIASSFSGYTTRVVSKFKPAANIIGLSPLDRTLYKMQLYWGVKPVKVQEVNSTDQLLEEAVKTVKDHELAKEGDILILTAGVPAGKTGVTNMIKAVTVE